MRILLVNPESILPSETTAALCAMPYRIEQVNGFDAALTATGGWDAMVLPAPAPNERPAFSNLVRSAESCGAVTMMVGDPPFDLANRCAQMVRLHPPDLTPVALAGRMAIIDHYHDRVRSMERDLNNMQRLFKQLNVQFNHVDQEMRLAGRLQKAFLPQRLVRIAGITCAALYRPATFVSGDMFDFFRVDEDHVGFWIADAVGHGMAASLLTMFIKNAVEAKRVFDGGYEVLSPDHALAVLNRKLIDQHLPSSQFVTACYALLNIRTRELHCARAGHPYPLLCAAAGGLSEIKSSGGLLGLFPDETFPPVTVTLNPGDKLLLYSDGVEVAFLGNEDLGADRLHAYRAIFAELAPLGVAEMVAAFESKVESAVGSLNPEDDLTLLAIEIDEEP